MIAKLISAYMKSSGDGLFTTRTAGELLWGYKDGLLTALKKSKPDLDDVFGLFYKVLFEHMNTLLYILFRLECLFITASNITD